MKEDKSIITYETLKKEFRRYTLAKLPLFALLFILALAIVFKVVSAFKEAFSTSPFSTGLLCYAMFILMLDIVFFVGSFIPVYELIQINRCRFLIFEDRLLSMGEEYVKRKRRFDFFDSANRTGSLGNMGSYKKVFNFKDYGQYIVTPRDMNAYNYSSPEDHFIVVSLDVALNDTVFVYNKKVYEFKDGNIIK